MISSQLIRISTATLLLAGLIGAGQPVSAYTQGACRADGEKLCPGLTGKELTPCLKAHQAELSEPCKVNLAEARQVVRDLYESCGPDIEAYCPNVPVGEGRIRKCLRDHEATLTANCKAEIAGARERYKSILPTTHASTTTTTTTLSTSSAPAAK